MPGYSVIAVRAHIKSAADLDDDLQKEFAEFSQYIRGELSSMFGNCIMSEHGRMPVCFHQAGLSEPHCYHAHFLLFPGAPSVDPLAVPYFDKIEGFDSLSKATGAALAGGNEYYLLSSLPNRFLVMTKPEKHIRQFSRALVSAAIGKSHLASWQDHPNAEEALRNAKYMRKHFQEGHDQNR